MYSTRLLVTKTVSQVATIFGKPGIMYMAAMTGVRHFVEHRAEDTNDLLQVAGLGPVKVVLILRCAVFRESMASIPPNPNLTHAVAQEVLREWFAKHTFKCPTMEDIVSATA